MDFKEIWDIVSCISIVLGYVAVLLGGMYFLSLFIQWLVYLWENRQNEEGSV